MQDFTRATQLLRRNGPGDHTEAEALLLPILDGDADAALKGRACYALGYRHESCGGSEQEAEAWLAKAAAFGDAQAIDLIADRKRGLRVKRLLDMVVFLLLICAGFAVWTLRDLVEVVAFKEKWEDEVPGSDPRIVPDVAWRDDVFSIEKRRDLVAKGEHLLRVVGDANPLSEEGFGGTRGVVLHFTRAAFGDAYAFQHPAYAWLYEGVLRELLDDRCDAFVFNILVVPPRVGIKYRRDAASVAASARWRGVSTRHWFPRRCRRAAILIGRSVWVRTSTRRSCNPLHKGSRRRILSQSRTCKCPQI